MNKRCVGCGYYGECNCSILIGGEKIGLNYCSNFLTKKEMI